MKFNFKCSGCGDACIEEIMVNVTQASELVDIELDHADYGEQTNGDSGVIDRFQCMGCGLTVGASSHADAERMEGVGGTITTYEELFDWLKGRGFLVEDTECTIATFSAKHPPQQGDSCPKCPGVLYGRSTWIERWSKRRLIGWSGKEPKVICDQCGWHWPE